MPLDPYALCPGGTGKKLKFCCSDLLADLEKIQRMIEAEQHLACLDLVQRLEQKHPDRACLMASKTMLLRAVGRVEEARAATAVFLEKHPRNPVALAESAIAEAIQGEGRLAMDALSRAIEASGNEIHGRLYAAMTVVSEVLAGEGDLLAAREVATMQAVLRRDDPRPVQLLMQLNTAPQIPLLIRDHRKLAPCPDDVPWKADLEETVALAHRGHWHSAAERLQALAERVGGQPAVWHNLAVLRGWLADTSGSIAALCKYASLDVPPEDAVEAQALAMLLSDDPLSDEIEVLNVRYTVRDVDTTLAELSAASRATQLGTDMRLLAADDEPPPIAAFVLFDRSAPKSEDPLTLESVSRMLCRALLFGRQTDRPARLELIDVCTGDLAQVKSLLAELAHDPFATEPEQEVTGHVSATRELLIRNWRLPEGTTPKAFHTLDQSYLEDTLLDKWPKSPLGLLDGKSPEQAAGEEAYRVKLLAAILVLDCWLQQGDVRFDCNRLRSRLGLPTLEPIDPKDGPVQQLPLVRLSRVIVENLSDEALLAGYRHVLAFNAQRALERFARALVERPSMAGRRERLQAYSLLARLTDDPEEALRCVDQGRQAAVTAGQSSASWDLLELSLRLRRAEGPQIARLIEHLQREHLREPGVAEALTDLLVRAGVLRPDGTLAAPAAAEAEKRPSIVLPSGEQAEAGKLWTPGGQEPAAEKPKIWTPDQG